MWVLGLAAVAALVVVTGVFVAAEFAFVAVDRSRVENRAEEGKPGAVAARRVLGRLSFHLSGAQLGITVASVVLGFVAEPTVGTLLEPAIGRAASVAVALLGVTVGSMVVGELIPKNLSIARSQGAAERLARPMLAYGTVFGPVIRRLNATADATVRRLGIEPQEELTGVRSLEELAVVVRASAEEGTLATEAATLLTRALRLGEKNAEDVLVPRGAVESVAGDTTLTGLVERSVATGLSRFPVCGPDGDLDDLVGVVHVKDVYRVPFERRGDARVSEVMSPPYSVPEARDLVSLLEDLRTGIPLAVVVDEYGGTAGIVTLEDIMEEIVGDIDDEYDPAAAPLRAVTPAGVYELPAGLHPEEVADACGFQIPEGPYETLAGFVLAQLAKVPQTGEWFIYGGWRIEVVGMDRWRIATVRLTPPAPRDESAPPGNGEDPS